MATVFRKSPPICLGISLIRIILGKLRYSKIYLGQKVRMKEGEEYEIFRHISRKNNTQDENPVVFVVSFKFARLTHKANKIASIIPMLMITGFPGFKTKIYAVNRVSGYWQGMYQWNSGNALEEYKKSFVFRTMNRRAISSSLSSEEITNQNLIEFIAARTVEES